MNMIAAPVPISRRSLFLPHLGHFRFAEQLHKGVEIAGRELMVPPDPELGIDHFSFVSVEHYIEKLNRDELPLGRAFPTTKRDRLIREIVLQLKTGKLDAGYFRSKYGVEIQNEFRSGFDQLKRDGWLTLDGDRIETTTAGLLQIDRHLPVLFDPQYRGSRYT